MSNNKNIYLLPLLYIVIGVLFCIFKDSIIGWMMTVAGVLFVANGIVQIVNKYTQQGVINVVIGVLVIVFGWTLLWLAMLVFGVLLIVSSVNEFVNSTKDTYSIVKMAVSVLIGILLVTNGFATIAWLFVVIGVVFIAQGVLMLLPLLKNK